jgi:hypothetical protein
MGEEYKRGIKRVPGPSDGARPKFNRADQAVGWVPNPYYANGPTFSAVPIFVKGYEKKNAKQPNSPFHEYIFIVVIGSDILEQDGRAMYSEDTNRTKLNEEKTALVLTPYQKKKLQVLVKPNHPGYPDCELYPGMVLKLSSELLSAKVPEYEEMTGTLITFHGVTYYFQPDSNPDKTDDYLKHRFGAAKPVLQNGKPVRPFCPTFFESFVFHQNMDWAHKVGPPDRSELLKATLAEETAHDMIGMYVLPPNYNFPPEVDSYVNTTKSELVVALLSEEERNAKDISFFNKFTKDQTEITNLQLKFPATPMFPEEGDPPVCHAITINSWNLEAIDIENSAAHFKLWETLHIYLLHFAPMWLRVKLVYSKTLALKENSNAEEPALTWFADTTEMSCDLRMLLWNMGIEVSRAYAKQYINDFRALLRASDASERSLGMCSTIQDVFPLYGGSADLMTLLDDEEYHYYALPPINSIRCVERLPDFIQYLRNYSNVDGVVDPNKGTEAIKMCVGSFKADPGFTDWARSAFNNKLESSNVAMFAAKGPLNRAYVNPAMNAHYEKFFGIKK